MGALRIVGKNPLRGNAQVPPDRQIASRALVLGALAEGETMIRARLPTSPGTAIAALHALGATLEVSAQSTRVMGRGLHGLALPAGAIECADDDLLALLAGVIAGQSFGTRLTHRSAEIGAPVDHLVGALRARGAHITGTKRPGGALGPPVSIAPRLADEPLLGLECELPEPNANAKGAILLSGLFCSGATAVSEPLLSPDHTERMLSAMGVPLQRVGSMIGFDGAAWNGRLHTLGAIELPSDATLAAWIAGIACVLPESRVALHNVSWNPTRTGFFDALHLLGARLLVVAKGDRAGNEPVAELQLQATRLRGGTMGGEVVFRCAEALPALCAIGPHAARGLQLYDGDGYAAADDPFWPRLAELLCSFGARAEARSAGLSIEPAQRLIGTVVAAHRDPRLVWAAVLCGLTAEGETEVYDVDRWLEDQPEAIRCLRSLGAQIEVSS